MRIEYRADCIIITSSDLPPPVYEMLAQKRQIELTANRPVFVIQLQAMTADL